MPSRPQNQRWEKQDPNISSPLPDLPATSVHSSSTVSMLRSHAVSSSSLQDKDVALVKRQLFNNQLITVNFLVDDLRFYLEIDK